MESHVTIKFKSYSTLETVQMLIVGVGPLVDPLTRLEFIGLIFVSLLGALGQKI